MSEIEKMYENAGINPIKQGYCDWDSDCPYPDIINNGCGDECPYWKYEDEAKYPPFTAEKQIGLIKWLELNDNFDFLEMFYKPIQDLWCFRLYWLTELAGEDAELCLGYKKTFEEALAMLVNNLWQSLTEEEKQQVKGILE